MLFYKETEDSLSGYISLFFAGVLIYISFMELMPKAIAAIWVIWGIIAFFIGIIVNGLIDMSIPEVKNPHQLNVPSDS